MSCKNCNCIGHVYEKCRHPIISYGVLLLNKNKTKILMNQRLQSLSLIELLRGRYVRSDYYFIKALFSGLTEQERDMINSTKFNYEDIYKFCFDSTNYFSKNKIKFDTLFQNPEYRELISTCSVKKENQWGFPKGRIDVNETPIECALREFTEETQITSNQIRVLNHKPLTEIFFGTNGRMYKHTYYVAQVNETFDCVPTILRNNHEINQIQWFDIKDAVDQIVPHYQKRRDIIRSLQQEMTFELQQKINTPIDNVH